jgi:hypothetical protein
MLIVAQLIKKFPDFYGIRRLIALFTRAAHWTLLSAKGSHPTVSQLFLVIHFIISYHLRPGPWNTLVPLCSHANIFHTFVISHMRLIRSVYLIVESNHPRNEMGENWKQSVEKLALFCQPSFLQWSAHLPDVCDRPNQWAWRHDHRPQTGSAPCLALHSAKVTERRDSYSVAVTVITPSSASNPCMWWSHCLWGYTTWDLQMSITILEFANWQAVLVLESLIEIG